MSERKQPNRRRCLTTGCNPVMFGQAAAHEHEAATGHRTAKWPVRSPEGRRRAKARNQSGYYDKYNVGAKSAEARGIGNSDIDWRYEQPSDGGWDDHKGTW